MKIYIAERRCLTMKNKVGYEWNLFDKQGRSLAKSNPSRSGTYFRTKKSALASAMRMVKIMVTSTLDDVQIIDVND